MRAGKLTNEQLDRLILSKFKHIRPEVACSPHIGVDCAAVDMGGRLAVLSTDPITAAEAHLGRLTVHISCNDAAAAGAEPIGLLVTLLLPTSVTEADIALVADELAAAAAEANVEIIGGHTEITESVTRMITCATVIAKAGEQGILTPAGMRPGDDLVLTKLAGLEGTAVIASDREARLGELSSEELELARGFMERVSVLKEGLYAAAHGAHAMHDVTEGGVLGAAWEMAAASGCGLRIEESAIPVHPITQKICALCHIDPLRLLSSGAMLIACEDGSKMAEGLRAQGVEAAVIAHAEGDGVAFTDGRPILPPEADELYRVIG